MYLRLYILIFSVLISAGIKGTYAEDKKSNTKQNWNIDGESGSDIYIDEELEGSGNREVKDDLESSGSGFGPDDEDGDGGSVVNSVSKDVKKKVTLEEDDREESGSLLPVNAGKESQPPSFPDLEIPDTHVNINNIGRSGGGQENESPDDNRHGSGVSVMGTKQEERATSFFAQPGILAGKNCVSIWCSLIPNFTKTVQPTFQNTTTFFTGNSSFDLPKKCIHKGKIGPAFQDFQAHFRSNVMDNHAARIPNCICNQCVCKVENSVKDCVDNSKYEADLLFFKSLLPDISSLDMYSKLKFKLSVLESLKDLMKLH